jgi:hypothetical protein
MASDVVTLPSSNLQQLKSMIAACHAGRKSRPHFDRGQLVAVGVSGNQRQCNRGFLKYALESWEHEHPVG